MGNTSFLKECEMRMKSIWEKDVEMSFGQKSDTETRKKGDMSLNHKDIIIPGYVAVIAAKLKDESGWNVIVGPKESSGISGFAKANFA